MSTRVLLSLTGCLLALLPAPPSAAAEQHPVEHFSRLPNFTDPALSPDGSRVAYLTSSLVDDSGSVVLVVEDLESGERTPLVLSANTEASIKWYRWANNERILISLRIPAERHGVDSIETRLLSIAADDHEDMISLYQPRGRGREYFSQLQDRVVDILPDDPRHILLALDTEGTNEPSVFRVDVYDAGRSRVVKGGRGIRDWLSDQQGRVRIGTSKDWDRGRTRIYHRPADGNGWDVLFEFNMYEEPGIEALGFGADPDILYYTVYNGDLKALYKISLATRERTLVHSDPEYDVEGNLVRAYDGGDIIGLRHWHLPGNVVYWDEGYVGLQKSLDWALPDFNNRLIDFSRDGNIYLLRSGNATTPAAYYVGDRRRKSLDLLAEEYPELGAERLFQRSRVRYIARDGTEITAYLMRPLEADAPLPAVLFPPLGILSGWPGGLDYWTAFFTDRGYAVLRPEYRGSAGYGYRFEQAGVRNWGLQMQDDLTDAARWLAERGTADPARMCIVGIGYGGYAAMMAALKTPDMFRCAVSLGGVSDLNRHINFYREYLQANYFREEIGSPSRDLRPRSPYHNVSEINTPLLLAHGEDDRIVDVVQSRRMAEEMQEHGKEVEYLELPEGDHYLSAQPNRHAFFRAMDRFLQEHLSPDPPSDE